MNLKKLYIHRGYGTDAPLRGEIEFATSDGEEIKLKLDEQLSQDIVRLCAEAVARAGRAAAERLTAAAMKTTAIEYVPDE